MATVEWGPDVADRYDAVNADIATPAVVGPMVDLLAELADDGRALEFAIGTGRIGLALAERGVDVHGIELSPHMAAKLKEKPGASRVPVSVGDMATTRVGSEFGLVYLVANTLMNVTTQDEQVAVFANAAAQLRPGGRFLIELIVPKLRSVPPGERGHIFALTDDHVGIETFDDTVNQIAWSRHWMHVNDRWVRHEAPYRYAWPAECDLMARLAGMTLEHRWGGWQREPFTAQSDKHVSVWRRPR